MAGLLGRPPLCALVAGEQIGQQGADWCRLGAPVDQKTLPLPLIPLTVIGHIGNSALAHLIYGRGWLLDRFKGVPASNTCGENSK